MHLLCSSLSFFVFDNKVKTNNGYEQFANFLQKEFSTENILFVTEVFLCTINNKKQTTNNNFLSETVCAAKKCFVAAI